MGFDGFLVPEFAKPYIGWVVGMNWPEGDETGCFRLADACITAAHRLVAGTGADQPESASKIGAAWDGEAHLAFAAHVDAVIGGQLALTVKRLVDAAVALNGVGVQIQYTKYMIEITVWLLIAQLAYLLGAALATGGASLALIPPRLQLARMTITQIARQCVRNILMFAGIVAGMDFGIQSLQMLKGRRDEIDLNQLAISAVSGGAMGGLMGAFAGGLTRLATPALRAGLTRAEMSAAEKLLAAASRSLYGQAGQFAVAGGLTTAGTMAYQGHFDWDLLLKGITSSALGADGQHLASPLPHGADGAPPAHPAASPERPPSSPDPVPGTGDGTHLSAVRNNQETINAADWNSPQRAPDGTQTWKSAPAHQPEVVNTALAHQPEVVNTAQPTTTAAVRPDGSPTWKPFDPLAGQPKPPIHPPRAVEIGALGETAVHDVKVPANPRTTAQALTDGITGIAPRERAAVRHWLTDVLSDGNRDTWTDHLQRGVALSVGDKLIYVKLRPGEFTHLENPSLAPEKPVAFGGDGVEGKSTRATSLDPTAGLMQGLYHSPDEAEASALPRTGISSTARTTHTNGTEVISGHKAISPAHDYFAADITLEVYRDGYKVARSGAVPELSLTIPFPKQFTREGPLLAGDHPPPLPRHQVPVGAEHKFRDHGIAITGLDVTPLVLEVQRRGLESGLPAREVVKIVEHLTSTLLTEQGVKNRSQSLLSSGASSEAVRYKSSTMRSAEDSVTISSRITRIEPIDGSTRPPVETMFRDDLGRRESEGTSTRRGTSLNVHAGGKLGVSFGDAAEVVARANGGFGFGTDHVTSANRAHGNHTVVTRSSDVTMYDAYMRVRVESETMGTFEVGVKAELVLPARDAPRMEQDVFGRDLRPRGEFNDIQQKLADLHRDIDDVRADHVIEQKLADLHHEIDIHQKLADLHRDIDDLRADYVRSQPYGEHPATGEHPERPATGEHPERPATGEHPERPATGEHPERPATGEHPNRGYDPHALEPELLAAGRGTGLGSGVRVHSETLLSAEIRKRVDRALPGLPPEIRRQIMRDIDSRFGGSALEADLTHAIHGIRYDKTIGGYTFEILAEGTLGRRHGVASSDMTVNERRIAQRQDTSQRESSVTGRGEVRGVARVEVSDALKVDPVNLSATGSRAKAEGVAFSSGHTRYDRTETSGGFTVTRDLSFDVRMRITRDGTEMLNTTRHVHGSKAEILVPNAHLPKAPVLALDVARLGRIESSAEAPHDVWRPRGDELSGIVRLGAMPDLPGALAQAYASWSGLRAPAERLDVSPVFETATDVINLETMITAHPDGLHYTVSDRGGTQYDVHVKAHAADVKYVKSETGVEHENYSNSNSRMTDGERDRRVLGGHARSGLRVSLGEAAAGGTERKVVARAGVHGATKRMTAESSYLGGSDVARVTYSDGSTSHWYRGDLVLEVTPSRTDGTTVERGPTTYVRVGEIMDLVLPDEVARRHGLEGPKAVEPVRPAGDMTRAYVAPEAAMNNAAVQHLDAKDVLPKIIEMLREDNLLFQDQEFTNHPVAENLRGNYGEAALSRKLGELRGSGVTSWLIATDENGRVTERVGIRVTATLGDGVHVGERPDTGLMIRNERLSGDLTVREAGTDRGAEALGRYLESTDGEVRGGEAGYANYRDSHTVDGQGTIAKEINRYQTREAPQEFRHPVTYEITIERVPVRPLMEPVRNAAHQVLLKVGELTGHDAARLFDRQAGVTSPPSAVVHGDLGVLVPGHLTMEVPQGTPIAAGTPVGAADPRWAETAGPNAMSTTLGQGLPKGDVSQVAFPAAGLVEEWAPLSAVPPKLRAEVPSLAGRPSGYELSNPAGMSLAEATKERTMRANLGQLLAHGYEIPGIGRVGINVNQAHEVTSALVKQRVYAQTMATSGHGQEVGRGQALRGGGSAGSADGTLGFGGVGGSVKSADEAASRNANIVERNFLEKTHDNTYLEVDLSLVLYGTGTPLVLDVPGGLYLRLTPEGLAEFEAAHPGMITR